MPETISQAFQPRKGKFFAPDHRIGGGLGVKPLPKDAIMAATDAFKADTRKNKVNLGIGVCSNEGGELVVPNPVQRILASDAAREMLDGNYLPGQGDEKFLSAASNLIFGNNINPANTTAIQTIGGTNHGNPQSRLLSNSQNRNHHQHALRLLCDCRWCQTSCHHVRATSAKPAART